jgi:hypothetical protein
VKLEGGCYCGSLRYLAEGEPTLKAQCHCRECQYISGGSPNMFMLMPPDGFSYTKGTPKQFTRSDLEQAVTREFCAECGTHILTRRPGLSALVLKIGNARRSRPVRCAEDGDLHDRQATVPSCSRWYAGLRAAAETIRLVLGRACGLDLAQCTAQFGGEGTQAFAAAGAVAGLAGLFECCRRCPDTVRADGLCRAFELVRGRRERRQVARARGGGNLALRAIAVSRNFASSELIAAASSPSHAASTSRSIAAAGFAGASACAVSRETSSIGIQRSSVARS